MLVVSQHAGNMALDLIRYRMLNRFPNSAALRGLRSIPKDGRHRRILSGNRLMIRLSVVANAAISHVTYLIAAIHSVGIPWRRSVRTR